MTTLEKIREKNEVVNSCKNCRYYHAFPPDPDDDDDDPEEDDPTGVCRRYPPRLLVGGLGLLLDSGGRSTGWPEVNAKTGWCGEHVPVS